MHRQLKRLRGEAAGRCGNFSKHRRRTREWDCWCVVHIHRRCRILVQTLSLKLIFRNLPMPMASVSSQSVELMHAPSVQSGSRGWHFVVAQTHCACGERCREGLP